MRFWRIAALSLVILATLTAVVGAAEGDVESILVAQGADVSGFPTIALTVTLPIDMLAAGEADPVFTVLENDVESDVLSVEPLAAIRPPLNVVLLIDTSGSMIGDPMTDARTAASAFVAAMAADDEIAVVSFSTTAEEVLGFTSDRAALNRAIGQLEAGGYTALYDGVVRASAMLAERDEGRDRVVVLLTDGGDTASVNTIDEAVSQLSASGAPVYAIGLETPETDMDVLATMAAQSGGRMVGVADSGDLERLYQDIARELTTQYRVTFESVVPNTKDLELRVVAELDGRRGSALFVIDNPYFFEATGEGEGTEPASPYASIALGGLVIVLAFLSTVLGAGALMGLFGRRSSRLDELHFYDQLRGVEDKTTTRAAGVTGAVRDAVAVVAGRRGITPLVHQKLERAGLPLRPVEYIYLHLLAVIGFGVLTQLLTGSIAFALLVVVATVATPILLLEAAIARRRHTFEDQLPEILSMIAGSLRAGWGVQQSIDLVVQEMSDPAASEFRRVQAEARLGLSVEDALSKMAERLDSDDFRWTVTAIAIQREVGGNLAEVLDLVAGTMRERAELRRHIRALTSEGRLSAIILFVLPFAMMGLLLLANPTYMALMFTTAAGLVLLAIGAVLLIVGGVWLRRASEVEI